MVIVCVLTITQLITAGQAHAQTGPVDWAADGIGNLVGGGVGAVAKKVADAIFNGVLEFIAGLIADAVTAATNLLISVFDAVDVHVAENGFLTGTASSALHLQMVALGTVLVMLLWLVRICSGLINQQMAQVIKELFFDLPFTVIGTAASGAVGFIILSVTNEMSDTFSSQFADNIGTFAGQFFGKDLLLQGGIFQMFFAVFYIFGAIMVGFELIIRASLLTIIFAVAPVMVATRTWQGTRRYARRFVEIAIALMFAKPAAAFALALGTAQLSDAEAAYAPVKMMIGTTITILAAFMPFAIFKLLPVVEAATVQHGIKGAPVRVAQTAVGLAASAAIIAGGSGAAAAGRGAAGGGHTPGTPGGSADSNGAPPDPSGPVAARGGAPSRGGASTSGGDAGVGGSGASRISQTAGSNAVAPVDVSAVATWLDAGPAAPRAVDPLRRRAALHTTNRVLGSLPTTSAAAVMDGGDEFDDEDRR